MTRLGTARSRLGRIRRLDAGELLLGLQAPVLLPLFAFALDRWGLRRVQHRLVSLARRRTVLLDGPAALEGARRLSWVVETAARRGPWRANCLQRSLLLWWYLYRRGLSGDLRIGVRRRPDGVPGTATLDFHAWVEHAGVVLNDVDDIRERFATFDRAIAPVDARWR